MPKNKTVDARSVLELAAGGLDSYAVAKELGTSYAAVNKCMVRAGVVGGVTKAKIRMRCGETIDEVLGIVPTPKEAADEQPRPRYETQLRDRFPLAAFSALLRSGAENYKEALVESAYNYAEIAMAVRSRRGYEPCKKHRA